jgi:flagellar motility protein MotE (MotC chaperone)
MKKIAGLLLYGLALFGITAGIGIALRPAGTHAEHADTAAADEHGGTGGHAAKESAAEVHPEHLAIDHEGTIKQKTDPHGNATVDEPLPVAVRPEEMSIEQIVRLGLGLNEREESIREKESTLQKTEMRYQLLMADMQGERKELEGLQIQARNQRLATEEILKQIAVRKQELEASQAQMQSEKKEIEALRLQLERDRLAKPAGADKPAANGSEAATGTESDLQAQGRVMSPILEGMSPDKVATQLQEMADNGKMELAVAVITTMEKRKAAAVLDTMPDKKLVNSILEMIAKDKPVTKTAQKKR